jgi:hypothetical protein
MKLSLWLLMKTVFGQIQYLKLINLGTFLLCHDYWLRTDIQIIFLKGQCHEIFDPRFFRQTIPSRPLIKRLKQLGIWFRIRWDIPVSKMFGIRALMRPQKRFPGFIAVSIRLRKPLPGFIAPPAVSMKPLKPLSRFQWDRGSSFRGVNKTAETPFETA